MKQRRYPLLSILCFLLVLALVSCSPSSASPRSVLGAMRRAEVGLPAGQIYVRLAPQDGEAYLSDELLSVIFGNGSLPPEIELIADAALYLSYTQQREMAVFRCKSTDGTDAIAAMCLRRLDSLKSYWTDEGKSDVGIDFSSARVTICGKWVILTLCADPDAVLRAARRAL